MSPTRVFLAFGYEIFKGNLENELWWLWGLLLRSCNAYFANPLLLKYLLEAMDISDGVQLGQCILLAMVKIILGLVDHYTIWHYSSNFSISELVAPQWLLNHWNVLPLEVQLSQDVASQYREMQERVDGEFGRKTYTTITKAIELCSAISFSLLVAAFLPADPAQSIYLYCAYAFAFIVIFALVPRVISTDYATVNGEFWKWASKYRIATQALLSEPVSTKYMRQGRKMMDQALQAKTYMLNMDFLKYYIVTTQTLYTSWIMQVPEFVIYAVAAVLVDMGIFNTSIVVAFLSSFASARGSLIGLCEMREEWSQAVDMVQDFSTLLCGFQERIGHRATHASDAIDTIECVGVDQLGLLDSIVLHNVHYAAPDLSSFGLERATIRLLSGSCKLGELYGLGYKSHEDLATVHSAVILDLIGGIRVPDKGAVLTPPHSRVLVVPRQAGIIERDSVIANLTFGLEPGAHDESCVLRLCMKLGMSPHCFNADVAHQPLVKLLPFASPTDRALVALVRSLLHLPSVLLIHDLGFVKATQVAAIATVLERFVCGALVDQLASDEPLPEVMPWGRRTVVWGMPAALMPPSIPPERQLVVRPTPIEGGLYFGPTDSEPLVEPPRGGAPPRLSEDEGSASGHTLPRADVTAELAAKPSADSAEAMPDCD